MFLSERWCRSRRPWALAPCALSLASPTPTRCGCGWISWRCVQRASIPSASTRRRPTGWIHQGAGEVKPGRQLAARVFEGGGLLTDLGQRRPGLEAVGEHGQVVLLAVVDHHLGDRPGQAGAGGAADGRCRQRCQWPAGRRPWLWLGGNHPVWLHGGNGWAAPTGLAVAAAAQAATAPWGEPGVRRGHRQPPAGASGPRSGCRPGGSRHRNHRSWPPGGGLRAGLLLGLTSSRAFPYPPNPPKPPFFDSIVSVYYGLILKGI